MLSEYNIKYIRILGRDIYPDQIELLDEVDRLNQKIKNLEFKLSEVRGELLTYKRQPDNMLELSKKQWDYI
jgi:hypothetical protein